MRLLNAFLETLTESCSSRGFEVKLTRRRTLLVSALYDSCVWEVENAKVREQSCERSESHIDLWRKARVVCCESFPQVNTTWLIWLSFWDGGLSPRGSRVLDVGMLLGRERIVCGWLTSRGWLQVCARKVCVNKQTVRPVCIISSTHRAPRIVMRLWRICVVGTGGGFVSLSWWQPVCTKGKWI